jgi:hypothetical protein
MVLLASLLLLVLGGITRFAVGKPIMPAWLAKALHDPTPALPPGMTYDFQIIDPDTKHPLEIIPQVGNIELRLAVTNDSALPMSLRFTNGEQCEFVVRKVTYYADGLFALPLEVWRSSYFHNASPKPSTLSLDPGDTKVYSAVYQINALSSHEMPPGSYLVVANFHGWQTSIAIDKPL